MGKENMPRGITRRQALKDLAVLGGALTTLALFPENAEAKGLIPPYQGLKYDETGGNKGLPEGQQYLVAHFLRQAIDGDDNNQRMAIETIQKMAQAAHAETLEGQTVDIPNDRAYLVWHSNASNVIETPTDVTDVWGTHTQGSGKVWLVRPFAQEVPERSYRTFKCTEGNFWGVAVY